MNKTVYVFDVDGVLCEIGSPTIDERIIGQIGRLLKNGVYVAISTGRAYDRVGAEFVEPLMAVYPELQLDTLCVVTEMCGERTTYHGRQAESRHTHFSLRPDQLALFHKIYEAHRSELRTMYNYDAKLSMGTTVKYAEAHPVEYTVQNTEFERLLGEAFKGQDVIITGTTESTDVYAHNAGKNAGAKVIIEWLEGAGAIKHDTAVCFGDSHNDYEMAREFAEAGFATTFVYKGVAPFQTDHHAAVHIVAPTQHYTNGTVEFLSPLVNSEPGILD